MCLLLEIHALLTLDGEVLTRRLRTLDVLLRRLRDDALFLDAHLLQFEIDLLQTVFQLVNDALLELFRQLCLDRARNLHLNAVHILSPSSSAWMRGNTVTSSVRLKK